MSLEIDIPLDKSFNIDEGTYRGILERIIPVTISNANGPEKGGRFLFRLKIPSIKSKIPMAGRNFPLKLNTGSELKTFLQVWRGRKFFEANGGTKMDLESLIGQEADLVLTHWHKPGYQNPLVLIDSAFPPGTQDLTEEPETPEQPEEQGGV